MVVAAIGPATMAAAATTTPSRVQKLLVMPLLLLASGSGGRCCWRWWFPLGTCSNIPAQHGGRGNPALRQAVLPDLLKSHHLRRQLGSGLQQAALYLFLKSHICLQIRVGKFGYALLLCNTFDPKNFTKMSLLFLPFSCHLPLNISICLFPNILLWSYFSKPIFLLLFFLPFFPSLRFSVQLGNLGSLSPGTGQTVNEAVFVCELPKGLGKRITTSLCQFPKKGKKTRNTS